MLAHVHIMKTGGQTVVQMLRDSFPGQHCGLHTPTIATPADLRFAKRIYPRLKCISGHGVRPHANLESVCPDIRYFTFLRDPFERCISHYQFVVVRNGEKLPFLSWLKCSADFQSRMLCGARNADKAIEMLEAKVGFVGLQERFEESLVMLYRWARDPQLRLPRRSRNIASDNRIKDELRADPAIVAEIKRQNAEDFRLYRYACEVVYPRQLAAYGQELAIETDRLLYNPSATTGISTIAQTLSTAKRRLLYMPLAKLQKRWSRAA